MDDAGHRVALAGGRVEETDEQLAKKAAWGDHTAFRALTDRHAAYLLRVAISLVGSEADAEDVVQHTLVGAYKGLAGFRGGSSVKTWLTGIAVRQAARLRRTRSRDRTISISSSPDDNGDSVGGGAPGAVTASATAAVDSRIDAEAVLARLSPEHRQVIVLRELEGLSYEEIAETLGVPRGTVESRLHRARAELKEALRRYWT
jgi:RNA polymerase sigma-70 factor (ECF subfamily)